MDLPPDSRTALRDWLTEQLADLLGEPLPTCAPWRTTTTCWAAASTRSA